MTSLSTRLATLEQQVARLVADMERKRRPDTLEATEEAMSTDPLVIANRRAHEMVRKAMNTPPSKLIRLPSQGSPQADAPSPSVAEHLVASPEGRGGDAPQGDFTEAEYEADPHAVVAFAHATGEARVLRADGTTRLSICIPNSSTYCAICDGDALPKHTLLKGGGFVCEGCVVTSYREGENGVTA